MLSKPLARIVTHHLERPAPAPGLGTRLPARAAATPWFLAKKEKYTQILTIDGNEFAYVDEKFDITGILIKRFQK